MSLADELKKLADMRDSGALTEQEFQAAKHALLFPASGNGPGRFTVPRYYAPPDDEHERFSGLRHFFGLLFGTETGWWIIILAFLACVAIALWSTVRGMFDSITSLW